MPFCPWNSPDKNIGVGSRVLLQGIFPIQGSCFAGRFFMPGHLESPKSREVQPRNNSAALKVEYWVHLSSIHTGPPCPSPASGVYSTHVHWVGDAIQLCHPLSSPSPPAFNLSQHQSLFKWVSSSHQVAKVLEFTFSISLCNEYSGMISFRMDSCKVGSPCSPRDDSQESSPTPQFKSIDSSVLSCLYSPNLTSIHKVPPQGINNVYKPFIELKANKQNYWIWSVLLDMVTWSQTKGTREDHQDHLRGD